MNLREFNALSVGDEVENTMLANGKGTVSGVNELRSGRVVWITWNGCSPEFSFSVHSTAWMHWNKVEPDHSDVLTLGN